MDGIRPGDAEGEGVATNISAFESWDAAIAYANELMGGPVTVRIAGDSTIFGSPVMARNAHCAARFKRA